MAIDHREFFRILPRAMGDRVWSVEGERVDVRTDGGGIWITLGPEGQRVMARLSLPATEVTIRWDGVAGAEVQRFLDCFDRHFHRGGG